MARALAKVTVTLNFVSLTGRIFTATEAETSNKSICVGGHGGRPAHDPVVAKFPVKCDVCGEVQRNELAKGVVQDDGSFIVATTDEIAEAHDASDVQYKGKFDLLPHPRLDVLANTAPGSKAYYFEPDPASLANNALLADRIVARDDVAFTSLFTPRSRAGQYIASARDGVIVFEERVPKGRLRALPSLGAPAPDPTMGAMLDTIINGTMVPYDVDKYESTYAAELATRLAGRTGVVLDVPGKAKSTESHGPVLAGDSLKDKLAEVAAQIAAKQASA